MKVVLSTCLPIIIMIAIGMICRRHSILSREGIDNLKKVVINITLPALIFSAFAGIQYSIKNVIVILVSFSICLAAFLLGHLFKRLLKIENSYMPYIMTTFEGGMIGYALFQMLYPNENLGLIATLDIGITLFGNTIWRVGLGNLNRENSVSGKEILRDLFTSPIVIGLICGIVVGVSGLYNAMIPSGAAEVLDACTSFVGAPTGAIVLLTIGYDLKFDQVEWRPVLETVIIRVIIMVVLRMAVGLLIVPLHIEEYVDALNVLMILPTAYAMPIYAGNDEQGPYISSCLSVYTVLTIVAFVVLSTL